MQVVLSKCAGATRLLVIPAAFFLWLLATSPPIPAPGSTQARATSEPAGGAAVNAKAVTAAGAASAADQLWREAIDRSEQVSALTAKVRCQGELFDLPLRLEGRYWQLNRGGRSQVRYELARVADRGDAQPPARMLQLSDGRFLWEIEEQGGKRTVGRTDLRQLQQHPWPDKLTAARIGAGGLPKMLSSLWRDLQWSEPTADELDGIAVWRLSGRWKPRRAVVLSRGQADNVERWPSYVPDRVDVMLGQDDLVPYQIAYQRDGRPLLVFELFEVATPAFLDEELFRWLEAEPQIEDRTELQRQRMGSVF